VPFVIVAHSQFHCAHIPSPPSLSHPEHLRAAAVARRPRRRRRAHARLARHRQHGDGPVVGLCVWYWVGLLFVRHALLLKKSAAAEPSSKVAGADRRCAHHHHHAHSAACPAAPLESDLTLTVKASFCVNFYSKRRGGKASLCCSHVECASHSVNTPPAPT